MTSAAKTVTQTGHPTPWSRLKKAIARARNRALKAIASKPAPTAETAKRLDVAAAFNQKKYRQVWVYGYRESTRLNRSEAVLVLKAGMETGANAAGLERIAVKAKTTAKSELDRLVIECMFRVAAGQMSAAIDAALRMLAQFPNENLAVETARYATARLEPGGLNSTDLAYARSLVGWLTERHPAGAKPVSREMCIVLMNSAQDVAEGSDALEFVGEWLTTNGDDRGVQAFLQRFLPRLLARVQSGDKEPTRVRPLEDADAMSAYVQAGGASSIRRSAWWRWQLVRETTRRKLRAATPRTKRPSSIAFLTDQDNFLGPLYDAMKMLGWSVSQHRFGALVSAYKGMQDLRYNDPKWLTAPQKYEAVFGNPLFAPLLNADVVICEFASANAVWASHNLKSNQRLFLHLHAYEAFSVWPWMINWGGVDGIIYVSEPVRNLLELDLGDRVAMIPSTILPNIKTLDPPLPRSDAGRTLGMLGTVHRVKQPHMAIEIMEELRRRTGEDWRLRLTGRYFPSGEDEDEAAYRETLESMLAKAPAGSVVLEEFTDDIARWFSETDFLLSCSLREGTHEVVNEAMHHGTIPIVRDWPVMAPLGGPAAVYPVLADQLIYQSVHEAVDRILEAKDRSEHIRQQLASFSASYSASDRNAEAFSDFISRWGFQ